MGATRISTSKGCCPKRFRRCRLRNMRRKPHVAATTCRRRDSRYPVLATKCYRASNDYIANPGADHPAGRAAANHCRLGLFEIQPECGQQARGVSDHNRTGRRCVADDIVGIYTGQPAVGCGCGTCDNAFHDLSQRDVLSALRYHRARQGFSPNAGLFQLRCADKYSSPVNDSWHAYMGVIRSFNPVSDRSARTLVLGSMPGVRSLQASRYYAHPRNAFWPIMAKILNVSEESPYETRVQSLLTARIALWDVLHACVRNGSLDSAIETGSRVPNAFASFFKRHPEISLVCFNGP